jgi:hypothetical protein
VANSPSGPVRAWRAPCWALIAVAAATTQPATHITLLKSAHDSSCPLPLDPQTRRWAGTHGRRSKDPTLRNTTGARTRQRRPGIEADDGGITPCMRRYPVMTP